MAGEIVLEWGTQTEVTWTNSPVLASAIADNSSSALSDDLNIDALSPGVIDVMLKLKIKTAAGSPVDPGIYLYAADSLDGTNYSVDNIASLPLVGVMVLNAGNTSEWSPAFSLARAFGGVLPPRCKFKVENQSSLAFSATANDCELYYIPVYAKQL